MAELQQGHGTWTGAGNAREQATHIGLEQRDEVLGRRKLGALRGELARCVDRAHIALREIWDKSEDAAALLSQWDAAFKRYARPMATVRGKAKAQGVTSLLMREGPGAGRQVCRSTKLDLYGLALFLLPLVEASELFDSMG